MYPLHTMDPTCLGNVQGQISSKGLLWKAVSECYVHLSAQIFLLGAAFDCRPEGNQSQESRCCQLLEEPFLTGFGNQPLSFRSFPVACL